MKIYKKIKKKLKEIQINNILNSHLQPLVKIIEWNEAAELLLIYIWFIWFIPNGFMMINMVIQFNGYMVYQFNGYMVTWLQQFIPIKLNELFLKDLFLFA